MNGHVARVEGIRGVYRVFAGIMKQREHLEDLGVEEREFHTGLWWEL
jgi:hypothetical protein